MPFFKCVPTSSGITSALDAAAAVALAAAADRLPTALDGGGRGGRGV